MTAMDTKESQRSWTARITLGLFYRYLRSWASVGQGQATGAPAGTAPSVHQQEPVV